MTEHLVLHNDLVAVEGLWVHFIVGILVGKVEQNLVITEEVHYFCIKHGEVQNKFTESTFYFALETVHLSTHK